VLEREDMDILKDVKAILGLQNSHEREREIEKLSDVFEYVHGLSERDVVEGVTLLLAAALHEDNQSTKESFFHAVDNAVVYQHIGNRIDWDTLVASLPSLGKWELEYALDILGISGQARYLPILKEYACHADPEIREWADDAIENINSRVIHAADFPKAG
jgi:hypothetical protein